MKRLLLIVTLFSVITIGCKSKSKKEVTFEPFTVETKFKVDTSTLDYQDKGILVVKTSSGDFIISRAYDEIEKRLLNTELPANCYFEITVLPRKDVPIPGVENVSEAQLPFLKTFAIRPIINDRGH